MGVVAIATVVSGVDGHEIGLLAYAIASIFVTAESRQVSRISVAYRTATIRMHGPMRPSVRMATLTLGLLASIV